MSSREASVHLDVSYSTPMECLRLVGKSAFRCYIQLRIRVRIHFFKTSVLLEESLHPWIYGLLTEMVSMLLRTPNCVVQCCAKGIPSSLATRTSQKFQKHQYLLSLVAGLTRAIWLVLIAQCLLLKGKKTLFCRKARQYSVET